ncbi:MAG: hypothetical protein HQ582_06715 [Planctomycetes bacterium]|nr:hypothetical protein [Planctomycetota bacterium]
MPQTIDPNVAEHVAQQRIAELWTVCDRHAFYPAYDSDVLALAEGGGYLLSAKRLQGLFDANMICGVHVTQGKRRWTAADIMTLFALLETIRAYNPESRLHRPKLAAMEIQYHQAKAKGEDPFPDLANHSIESLLAYMAQSPDLNIRIGMWLALKEKLGLGVTDD